MSETKGLKITGVLELPMTSTALPIGDEAEAEDEGNECESEDEEKGKGVSVGWRTGGTRQE